MRRWMLTVGTLERVRTRQLCVVGRIGEPESPTIRCPNKRMQPGAVGRRYHRMAIDQSHIYRTIVCPTAGVLVTLDLPR